MALICLLLWLYTLVLIARAILSWVTAFGALPEALLPAARAVHQITEPVLAPLRRVIPPLGMFDMSFLVLILVIAALQSVLCG